MSYYYYYYYVYCLNFFSPLFFDNIFSVIKIHKQIYAVADKESKRKTEESSTNRTYK